MKNINIQNIQNVNTPPYVSMAFQAVALPMAISEIFGKQIRFTPERQAIEYIGVLSSIEKGHTKVVIALDDNNQLLGFLTYLKGQNPNYCCINILYVFDKFRKQGIGKQLVNFVKQRTKNVGVNVTVETKPFFKSLGFPVIKQNQDGWFMRIGKHESLVPMFGFAMSGQHLKQAIEPIIPMFIELGKGG